MTTTPRRVGVIFGRDGIGAYEEWIKNPTSEIPDDVRDNVRLTTFNTEAEEKAYLLGIEDAIGWCAEPYHLDAEEIAALGINDSCSTLDDLVAG
jgi:hypothetical protein